MPGVGQKFVVVRRFVRAIFTPDYSCGLFKAAALAELAAPSNARNFGLPNAEKLRQTSQRSG
jgi:hypothetical protein